MIPNFIKRLFQRSPTGVIATGEGGPRHRLEALYRDGEPIKVTGNFVIPKLDLDKLDWEEASNTQDTRAEPPRGSH